MQDSHSYEGGNVEPDGNIHVSFAPLEDAELSVYLRTLKPGGEIHPRIEGEICMISVYGSDKPGIVFQVSKELGDRNINITDLNTKLIGTEERPVYVMMLEAVLPDDMTVEDLEEKMNALKEKLQVDISVRPITPVEL